MSDKLNKPRKGEIDAWRRRRLVYDRHQQGETYPSIACDLHVSTGRARELSEMWKGMLLGYENYLDRSSELHIPRQSKYFDRRRREHIALFERLINAGLLGDCKRSPEYGYA